MKPATTPHAINAVRTKVIADQYGKFWALMTTDGLTWHALHKKGYPEKEYAVTHARALADWTSVALPIGEDIWFSDK